MATKNTRQRSTRQVRRRNRSLKGNGGLERATASAQGTLCGCRSLLIDHAEESAMCPRGMPWVCGGIPAAELSHPHPCNTGVTRTKAGGDDATSKPLV